VKAPDSQHSQANQLNEGKFAASTTS